MNTQKLAMIIAISVILLAPSHGMSRTPDGKSNVNDTDALWCEYHPAPRQAVGKKIVLVAGDDEYRSEEAMPMLAQILARHHGFDTVVLFPINPETGLIQPDYQQNIPGMHHLDDADLVIMGLRFRHLLDQDMKHFVDYVDSGRPIIGVRTSTHAFNYPRDSQSPYRHYSFNSREWPGGFGQQVLGDTWINHHGHHGRESTRGVIVEENKSHPVLKGVQDVWGPTDVYGIRHLPDTATVLLRGAVLAGMEPDAPLAEGQKNDPMMPLAWVKPYESKSGVSARIFCTTMGASQDFESEGLRRLLVNAAYWCIGLEDDIPERANVQYVSPYHPTRFGFGSYQKGLRPVDFAWK